MASSEKLVLPKAFLQTRELLLNAFAFDLKGQVSEAYDLYMQVTKLYAILFKKFPHVVYSDLWRRDARLGFSRGKQIFAYQAKGKLPHLKGVASKSTSLDQEEDLKESLWRTKVTPDLTAALVTRSDVFEKIQFNETFHDAAGEDIDFCFRVNQNHFKIYLARNLVAMHDFGYTGSHTDDLKLFLARFARYGSAEPLLSYLHPNYHSQFYSSIGLSIHQAVSQKVIPEFPFKENIQI